MPDGEGVAAGGGARGSRGLRRGGRTSRRLPAAFPVTNYSVMARFLIILGACLVLAGLLWPVLQKAGLGRLPGDIVVERENFRFYFPITTSLLVSIVLSLILWLLSR